MCGLQEHEIRFYCLLKKVNFSFLALSDFFCRHAYANAHHSTWTAIICIRMTIPNSEHVFFSCVKCTSKEFLNVSVSASLSVYFPVSANVFHLCQAVSKCISKCILPLSSGFHFIVNCRHCFQAASVWQPAVSMLIFASMHPHFSGQSDLSKNKRLCSRPGGVKRWR